MLKAGSYLTFSVQGHAGVQSPDDLARQVTGYLQSSGLMDVAQNDVVPTRDLLSDMLAGNILSWDYLATIIVRPLYDADSVTDQIQPTVMQAFADVTGYQPTGTFLEKTDTSATPKPPTPEVGLLDHFSNIGASLNSDVRLVVYGVLGLALVIVLLIAFAPNVPKLIPTVTV